MTGDRYDRERDNQCEPGYDEGSCNYRTVRCTSTSAGVDFLGIIAEEEMFQGGQAETEQRYGNHEVVEL